MYRHLGCLLILGFLILGPQLCAQRLGLLPPSVKWKQITDDSLRIIYPEGHEATARRVASLMLKVASMDPFSLESRYNPISVLLQPHTNISNGYVGLAPYVSEFYLQPNENPFSLGSLPWTDLLALHEYRHVQQVNAANRGVSHVVKFLFGELAFTGLYNLAVPNWFREGDAVYAETKWSSQGRGRLSSFTLPFRMKLLEGEEWNYYTLRNGSYKQYTPDHYPLGYLMVQYGNKLFGEATWDTILYEASRYKYLLSPFSGPIEARTGKRNKHLYRDAMDSYREQWNAEKVKDIEYPLVGVTERDEALPYFDMNFPVVNGDGSIYTSITTFDKTTAIYHIDTAGKRKKVVSMGLQQDPYFHHNGHRFVWTELRFDPRWVRRDQNVIVVYDQDTGLKISIPTDKGYYTPSLDASGNRIVALHTDPHGIYHLKILDARNGAVLASLPNPENLYLGYPIWTEDEKKIIATARNSKGEMAIFEQDIETGSFRQITHYSYHVLGKPVLHDHWIILTTSLDQLDQVYAVDRTDGIFYQVSGGNKAHYDAAWDPVQDGMISTEYHLDGKKLVRLPGLPRMWLMHNLDNGIKPVSGETHINLLDHIDGEREFEVKNYSPWFNAVNIHSLTLTADDPVWGLEVRSDNVLNNIALAAGYTYDRNTNASGPHFDVRFGMWYPEIILGFSQTGRDVETGSGNELRVINDRVNAGLALPLFYSSGIFQQTVRLSSTYSSGLSKVRPRIEELDDFYFNYLSHRVTVINSRRRAYRQAMPSWGQRADVILAHEVTGVPISQLYVSGDLAVPAVHPSHYVLLHGEFLSQDVREGSIQLSSPYRGARGFNQDIGKLQYNGGITYGLPLFYPDIGIGNIFYTRRVRLHAFYDVAFTNSKTVDFSWTRSVGAEAIVDFDFPPISIGLRYSYLLSGFDGTAHRLEFYLPVARF